MLSRAVFRSTDSYRSVPRVIALVYYSYKLHYDNTEYCTQSALTNASTAASTDIKSRSTTSGAPTSVSSRPGNCRRRQSALWRDGHHAQHISHTQTQTLLSIRYDSTSVLRAASKLPCNDFHPRELMSEIKGANHNDKLTKCFNQACIMNSIRMDFKMYK